MRWPQTKEQIIQKILNKYSTLHPKRHAELEDMLKSITKLTATNGQIASSQFLGKFTAVSKNCERYWLERGYSSDEAVIKARTYKFAQREERKKSGKKLISPYSREFWLARINPDTGENFTIEEADFTRNSKRPIRKEYWIIRGFSEEESIAKAKEVKDKNDRNGNTKQIKYSQCHVGFWIIRGYSLEEATQLLKERQTTFSLEKLQLKLGKEAGYARWKQRQALWQQTLMAKPVEEQIAINRRKMSFKNYGKLEKEVINELFSNFPEVEKSTQFCLRESETAKWFFFDAKINNCLIEFNGDYWHCNPLVYESTFFNQNKRSYAKEIWEYDARKKECAEKQGYKVFTIWEKDWRENKQKVIKECLNYINS